MIRFYRKASKKSPSLMLSDALENKVPGITQLYGDADTYSNILLNNLAPYAGDGKVFSWLYQLQQLTFPNNIGVTKASIAAAIFADLGFNAKEVYYIFSVVVFSGITACYADTADRPAGSFAPLKTSDIVYKGKPYRPVVK